MGAQSHQLFSITVYNILVFDLFLILIKFLWTLSFIAYKNWAINSPMNFQSYFVYIVKIRLAAHLPKFEISFQGYNTSKVSEKWT